MKQNAPAAPDSAAFHDGTHDHGQCIHGAVEQAERLCAEQGVRLTPLRRRVLELVWQRHSPIGAYEILDILRVERTGAAPPTVYRALDFLRDAGLVHRLESLNAFVGCAHPAHRHGGQFLICRVCKSVAELDAPAIANAVEESASTMGFTVESETIEVVGLCPRCGKTS